MSRTIRNPAPRYSKRYDEDRWIWKDIGPYLVGHLAIQRFRIRSPRDWKHAKATLSKENYADLRRQDGDCGTKFFLNGSLPRYWRNIAHREIRQVWQRERKKFFVNPDHEVIVEDRVTEQFEYW